MSIIMNHQCKTCNLDFTTSSNLRKHERTEKHLANCKLLTMVEPTTSDQKIKELEEKLAKAEQTILLQTQLIQSYQVIVLLTGLPDPMLPEVKLPEVKPEVAPDVPEPISVVERILPNYSSDRRRGRPSKPVPEVAEPVPDVVEPMPEVVEPMPEVIPEVIPEPMPEVIPEPMPEVVEPMPEPEPKPVKKLKKAKKATVEEVKTEITDDDQDRISFLQEYWEELETRLSFDEIKEEIKSYQAPNEALQKFKDLYFKQIAMGNYMDRRPKEEPKPEKPRRKLKIIEDPPKDLEAEVFKPEPKPEPKSEPKPEPETVKELAPEKPRRKLKIIQDPPKSIS